MTTIATTTAALVAAIEQLPETAKTRQILLDRVRQLNLQVDADLRQPRVDSLTAMLTLAWIAACKSDNGADAQLVAEMWMTERRQTAPAQVVHYYASMLELGHKPVFVAPMQVIEQPPVANVGKPILAAVERISESLNYVKGRQRQPIVDALMRHLTNIEIHLTATVGIRAMQMRKLVTKCA